MIVSSFNNQVEHYSVMQKTISILGSTGSVGKSAIDVIKKSGSKDFKVLALVAGSDYQALAKQAIELNAKFVAIAEEKRFKDLKEALSFYDIHVAAGASGVQEACSLKADMTIASISGIAGLTPVYQAISSGSDILLANKESMVCAGRILLELAEKCKSKIIPIDSEHNAIFQVFDYQNKEAIESIILTCSGGPFKGYKHSDLESIDVSKALAHPRWSMGKKISIDSATLFNKGLEVIEARYLFDIHLDKIKVVIHPESIIHGLVQYKDGSLLSQMGRPDMRVPITHALYWPKRYKGSPLFRPLNLTDVRKLTFEDVDNVVFPAIELCRAAFAKGEQSLVLLNAANEVAVQHFLEKEIKFLDIFKIVDTLLERQVFAKKKSDSIEEVIVWDREFRAKTKEFIQKHF